MLQLDGHLGHGCIWSIGQKRSWNIMNIDEPNETASDLNHCQHAPPLEWPAWTRWRQLLCDAIHRSWRSACAPPGYLKWWKSFKESKRFSSPRHYESEQNCHMNQRGRKYNSIQDEQRNLETCSKTNGISQAEGRWNGWVLFLLRANLTTT